MSSLKEVCSGLPLDPLPPNRGRDPNVPHAPTRTPDLTAEEERVSKHANCLLLIVSITFITEQCFLMKSRFMILLSTSVTLCLKHTSDLTMGI